jgi:hypothetical protein
MESFETKKVRGFTLRKDPARKACFAVANTDDQMISWPEWTDESKRERIHRHMNNEMSTTEVAAQCLYNFPEADWDLGMELAHQVWDESRHAMGLSRRLKELGGRKGVFPVANFEWAVSSYLDSIIGRVTVMNRTFEAGITHPMDEQQLASALFAHFSGTTREQALEDVKETLKYMRGLGLVLEQWVRGDRERGAY